MKTRGPEDQGTRAPEVSYQWLKCGGPTVLLRPLSVIRGCGAAGVLAEKHLVLQAINASTEAPPPHGKSSGQLLESLFTSSPPPLLPPSSVMLLSFVFSNVSLGCTLKRTKVESNFRWEVGRRMVKLDSISRQKKWKENSISRKVKVQREVKTQLPVGM